jgi:ferredoxin
MLIRVDRERCASSGLCVAADPEVFDQDDEGVVRLLEQAPTAERRDRVERAVRQCPTEAISTD